MDYSRRKIMIVDDNVANLTMGRNLLKSRYEVYLAPGAAQMFDMLEKVRPDLILLDIEMPGIDGYEAIARLKADTRFTAVPVIFLTAQNDEASELKGFDLGAVDYINKPFSPPLLLKRIEHQFLLLRQHEIIRAHADDLSVLVSEKVGEVISLQNAILGTVADLVEFRDRFTGGHIARTQLYLKMLLDGLRENRIYAEEITDWDTEYILQSAQLHDVGKIAVPDAILNKPARFTEDEFEIMKTHVIAGIDAVNRIIAKTKNHAFLRHTLNLVGAHHEKWDGSGYPYGLKGAGIPLEGRLMAIADVYDALVSWRPYKNRLSHEQALEIIRESSGTHFDPVLVEVFLQTEKMFRLISSKNAQDESTDWSLIALTKPVEIGIPEIDGQHKELLNKLNRAVSMGEKTASREETQAMLDYLGGYIHRHFKHEEMLQQESDYPKYEWHKSLHQLFTGNYQQLKKEFADNGFSAEFSFKLNSSIIDWIIRHIQSVDLEFGQYYQIRNALPIVPKENRGLQAS